VEGIFTNFEGVINLASTNKTANLGLSQWEASDAFTREDLNADFGKIDGAAFYMPVKLADRTADAQTQSITFDLSDKNLDQFDEIEFYADLKREKNMRINGVETSSYSNYTVASNFHGVGNNMMLYPGISRMSITKKQLVCSPCHDYVTYTMDRTVFPSLRTFEIYGNESNPLSAGDRISIWGVRR